MGNELIAKLEKRRIEEGKSQREFAAKLGISSELWRLICLNKRRITDKTASLIGAVYPELKADVLLFLSRSVDMSLIHREGATNTPQKPQFSILGLLSGFYRELVRKFRQLFLRRD